MAKPIVGLGRGRAECIRATSFESLTTYDSTEDYFFHTRPTNLSAKSGTSGNPVKLVSNYFEVKQLPDFSFTQYNVSFVPELDVAKVRHALIAEQRPILGGHIYDGGSGLFLTKNLPQDEMTFNSKSRDGKTYTMTIKKTNNEILIKSKMGMFLLNVILRRALDGLKLQLIRRNLFDPNNKINLSDYGIELWPGYVTSIRLHEDEKIMLCCEISHKVLRQETVYDILEKAHEESSNYKDQFVRDVLGSVVITSYNNKSYRVDDVDWSKNVKSIFTYKNKEISFVDYYKMNYGITIRNLTQPLLVSAPKPRDVRAGRQGMICLVPELCLTTGLTDSMRNNFQLMRAMADYTRMDPNKRVKRLKDFNSRLLSTPASAERFKEFETSLQPRMVELVGRQLEQEKIIFGNDRSVQNDDRVDWTNPMKMNEMFQNQSLTRWGIIYPSRAKNDVNSFLKLLNEVGTGMRYVIKEPQLREISDDRVGTYCLELENFIRKDPRFIMIVLPNSSADRYSAIKKITCVTNQIPTQAILQKTMQPKKGNIGSVKSIATKVLIQMNCKLGGAPWMVKIPLKGLMTIGFDVSHDTSDKSKSYGAFVATMDLQKKVKYYSAVASHAKGEEIAGNIALQMRKALCVYVQEHGSLPEQIMFYRDGVGEGSIQHVHTQEVQAISEVLREVYTSNENKPEPKFSFIIVSKRINTRFMKPKGDNFENPIAGTVIDSVVTLPERYDFYLISQSVRQGTVSPTSYNIIYDTSNLTPDKMQRLTYKMCHLYYNWSGTTRVPNVLQYCQKLSVLVAQYIHQIPHLGLSDQLYFL